MDDLISREALLADIERDIENSGCVNHEREIMDCIRYAPTVAAEPVRHARWEYRNNSKTCERIGDFEEWLVCSACDMEVECEYPNCPYCTARMDLDPATEKEDSK